MNQKQLVLYLDSWFFDIIFFTKNDKQIVKLNKFKEPFYFYIPIFIILLFILIGATNITLAFADKLPSKCGKVGQMITGMVDNEITIPEQSLVNYKVITVTTTSNSVNGNISNVNALLNYPGHDGISLREAVRATNNDSGNYKICFDSQLKGSIINTGSKGIPPLSGGNVIINGDIDGDNKPDITIHGSNECFCGFNIASSGNTLNALSILNYTIAVSLATNSPSNKIFANNTIKNLDIRDTENGIRLSSFSKYPDVAISNETWKHNFFIGNNVESSHSGIAVSTAFSANANIDEVTIANNNVNIINKNNPGNGIYISNGFGSGSQKNTINNIYVTNNTITGYPNNGIGISAGFGGIESGGSKNNTINNVIINDNKLTLQKSQFAIAISCGLWDGSELNRISKVEITDNYISGISEPTAINVSAGAVGSSKNTINQVRIIANDLELKPTSDAVFGICAIVGDAGTDWQNQNYRPISYPEYNKISDIEILDNHIEGVGSSGIFISLGCLGARYNKIHEAYLIGNNIEKIGYSNLSISGINISGSNDVSEVEGMPPLENEMTDIYIQANSIRSGGIKIRGGELGAENNKLKNILVAHNYIKSDDLIGIDVVGGWGHIDEIPSNNTISNIEIYCNSVDSIPKKYGEPDLKGISIMGGRQWSYNNKISTICLHNNLVANIINDIFVKNNSKYASSQEAIAKNNIVKVCECDYKNHIVDDNINLNISTNTKNKAISDTQVNKVKISISLLPLQHLNQDAEYWLIMFTSKNNYYCMSSDLLWNKNLVRSIRLPLLNLYNIHIPTPPLKQGENTIYFAVDDTPDGDFKNDKLWYDSVKVYVQ